MANSAAEGMPSDPSRGSDTLTGRADAEEMSFEAAYEALEGVVSAMESGTPALAEALELYERGVALARRCDELLTAAEARVRVVDSDGEDVGELAAHSD